jgi:glutamate-1-semialdehyde 2,1-aminomutase
MGAAGTIPAQPEFLRGLRQVTQECGVLLILDEVITFRLGYGGIQAAYGVQPDLTALGKLIGGGLPVGAFGGRADIMATFDPTRAGTISHSGTYNGNAATMAAGIAALELLTAEQIERLNRLGDGLRTRLQERVNGMGVDAILTGKGSLLQIHFTVPPLLTARDAARGDTRLLRLLHLALLTRGIFAANRQLYVLSTPMGEQDTETFARAFEDGLGTIAAAVRKGSAAAVGVV